VTAKRIKNNSFHDSFVPHGALNDTLQLSIIHYSPFDGAKTALLNYSTLLMEEEEVKMIPSYQSFDDEVLMKELN
jgi:hypothetical protein